jgi:hypothetical protein
MRTKTIEGKEVQLQERILIDLCGECFDMLRAMLNVAIPVDRDWLVEKRMLIT